MSIQLYSHVLHSFYFVTYANPLYEQDNAYQRVDLFCFFKYKPIFDYKCDPPHEFQEVVGGTCGLLGCPRFFLYCHVFIKYSAKSLLIYLYFASKKQEFFVLFSKGPGILYTNKKLPEIIAYLSMVLHGAGSPTLLMSFCL